MRPRLAYFSPLPPTRSGIADYSQELLPALAAWADITLFSADPDGVAPELASDFPLASIETFAARRWQFDLPLFHMGNSGHHAVIYDSLLRYPGLVVLHDYGLHHFIAHQSIGHNRRADFTRAMGYALGPAGVTEAWRIYQGEASHRLYELPLNERLLDHSLGLIVHSQYVRKLIQTSRPGLPVTVIPHLVQSQPRQSLRARLPWPADAIIFASAGQITASKQVDFALRQFARLRAELPQARYLIVGEALDVDLNGLIAELNLSDIVHQVGFVPDFQTFVDWLGSVDVLVNLRQPTLGETSGAALRALAAGRPLIVFDHGWYAEIPDAAAIKIPPMNGDALFAALRHLGQNSDRRQTMGQAAQAWIAAHHQPAAVARAYQQAVIDTIQRLIGAGGRRHD